MSQTIQQQVFALEEKRSLLNAQIMEESDAENRNRLESELRAVEAALGFYREALKTKARLAQSLSRNDGL
jgi:hypothetical protein